MEAEPPQFVVSGEERNEEYPTYKISENWDIINLMSLSRSIVSSETTDAAKREYETGRNLFERGQYGRALGHLEKASALADRGSSFGGDVQIWLVTAYQAAGREKDAIALCEKLTRHPQWDIRKQSRRLLDILKAPRLSKRPEWLTQIPDLGAVEESDRRDRRGQNTPIKKSPAPKLGEPVDLTQVNTKDNGFVWLALVAILLILGSFFWI